MVTGGDPRPVPGLRRGALLAVLALSPGDVVSTDRLIDIIWNGRPPATALNTLQRHISALRGLLGDRDVIVARPPGYLLDLDDDGTDLQVFTRLLTRARSLPELRQVERGVVPENGRLQLPSRGAGVQAQVVDQIPAQAPVGCQGLRLLAGAVQRQHELGVQPLTPRVPAR